jgi:hypothetical protein
MSDLLRACLKAGLTEVRVVNREIRYNILGRAEIDEETVIARQGEAFVRVKFSWRPGALGVGRASNKPGGLFWETINEAEYRKLTKSKRRIDTPKAIRDLEKKKKRSKGGRHGRRGSTG